MIVASWFWWVLALGFLALVFGWDWPKHHPGNLAFAAGICIIVMDLLSLFVPLLRIPFHM